MSRLPCIFTLSVFSLISATLALKATDSCDAVQQYYRNQQLHLQASPFSVNNLNVCSGDYTCCTTSTEDLLSVQSMKHIQSTVLKERQRLAANMSKRHDMYDAYFEQLIERAKNSLDVRFVDTYGTLYVDNKMVFMKFFDDLKLYYRGDVIDLTDIFDNFFTILMQRVFKLLHPGNIVDEDYMQCIASNLNVINPFAELPQKLSNQIQRSFIAARTLVEALKMGQRVLEDLGGVYLTTSCVKDFMKMYHCSKCGGHVEIKPCSNTCDRVLTECLRPMGEGELDTAWRRYVEKMMAVVRRLKGSFDIELVLSPTDVKISEAIMMLQENKLDIRNAVIRQCGELPKNPNATSGFNFGFFRGMNFDFDLSKNAGESSQMDLESWNRGKDLLSGFENLNFRDYRSRTKRSAGSNGGRKENGKRRRRHKHKQGRKHKGRHMVRDSSPSEHDAYYSVGQTNSEGITLSGLLDEMLEGQAMLKRFWKGLPKAFCEANAERQPLKSCWNGNEITKNIPEIEDDALKGANSDKNMSPDASMKRQIIILREMTARLANAYRGVDPAFVDGEASDVLSSGEGSGDEEDEDRDSEQEERIKGDEKFIKDLKHWEIDLMEKALGRSIDTDAKVKDIKHILRKHPLVLLDSDDTSVPSDEAFGKLSSYQHRQLKKMLGIPVHGSEKGSIPTTKATVAATTSSGISSARLFSLPLLVLGLSLQWMFLRKG